MAFVPVTSFHGSAVPTSAPLTTRLPAAARPVASPDVATRRPVRALFSTVVDDYMAASAHRQYIAQACPTGEPPIQCIEGHTASEPYELRTLKRQSELRYYQQPTAVKLRNLYAMRRAAVTAAHGCSHEEAEVATYPRLAAAYVLGQAEASRACSRYFAPRGKLDVAMARSVENANMKAVNGSGVFGTACTDGQARYEAYLAQTRGKSTMYRAKQYSVAAVEGMRYAARKQAFAWYTHGCDAEEKVFNANPIAAAAMRPGIGYYPPFVKEPVQGYTTGVARPEMLAGVKIVPVSVATKVMRGVPAAAQ